MAPDVTDGVVKALLESIALQSQCYEAIDLQSVRMDDGPDDSLLVTTKCELTITETMLYCGFPNLVKYGKWSALVDKMLGKKIVIHGSTHSFWDHASGRVRRLQWKADILTSLRRLLGVFNGARMFPVNILVSSSASECWSYVQRMVAALGS
ncbi:hypothetical protein PI124_g18610 [Phytophthora idaei]|nr:hypothetical protein PI125_g22592 [Phytophthora idaei]KAG3130691.1 hypothetical protein PI126_g20386 [Phytophthora idaei]KAG3236380.1 hypothetical protein PI124_g18610 [Phytophthora idaei]